MAEQAVRPSSDESTGERAAAAGAPSTSSSPPSSASPSASCSGPGASSSAPLAAPLAAFPPLLGDHYGVWLMPGVVAAAASSARPGAGHLRPTLARRGQSRRCSARRAAGSSSSTAWCRAWPANWASPLIRYRRFGWPQALLAAATAGLSTSILDLVLYYPVCVPRLEASPYTVFIVVSSMLLAGVVGLLLVRALARTGALSSFAAGRSRVSAAGRTPVTHHPAARPPEPGARRADLPASSPGASASGTRPGGPGRCRDVDLVVEPGERVLLTGASGAGQVHAAARPSPASSRTRATEVTGELTVDGAPAARRPVPAGDARPGPGQPAGHDPGRGRRRLRAGERRRAARSGSGRGWTRRSPPSASRTARDRPTQALSGGREAAAGAGRRARPAARAAAARRAHRPARPGRRRARAGRRRPRRRPTARTTVLVVDHDAAPWLPLVDRVVELRPGGAAWSTAADWRPAAARRRACASRRHRTDRSCSRPTPPASPTAAAGRPALPPDRRRRCAPGRTLAVTGPNGVGQVDARPAAGRRCARPRPAGSTAAPELTAGVRRGRRAAAPLAGRGAGHPHRHGLPEPRAAVPHRPAPRRARPRARCGPGSRAAAARATADELLERLGLTALRRGQPVHALRRAAAPAVGGDRAGHLAAGAGARRADVRPGRRAPGGELVTLLAEQRAAGCAVVAGHPRRRPRRRPGRRRLTLDATGRAVAHDASLALGPAPGVAAVAGSTRSPSSPRSPSSRSSCSPALDVVTPAVVVAAELCLLPAAGLTPPARDLWRRTWPLLLGAAQVGVVNVLLADDATAGHRRGASRCGVVGLALPGVLLVASTDPVRLADALTIHWRVSTRFAYGALAALRLVPLLATEFEAVRLARRTRGVDGRPQPGRPRAAVRRHRLHPAGRRRAPGLPAGDGDGRPRVRLRRPPHERPGVPAAPPRDAVFVAGTVAVCAARGRRSASPPGPGTRLFVERLTRPRRYGPPVASTHPLRRPAARDQPGQGTPGRACPACARCSTARGHDAVRTHLRSGNVVLDSTLGGRSSPRT